MAQERSQDTALIVGVGPGLGGALARRFAAGGARVAVAARRLERIKPIAEPLGAHAYACDVTDEDQVAALFEAVDRDIGPPSAVVFNAGAFRPGGILEIAPETFETSWRVACFGGFLVGRQAARRMVAAGRGSILFTGATAALRGSARFANLAVPKFGLRALAQSMARELGPQGVHVAHFVIDGHISPPDDPAAPSTLDPDAIAEAYWQVHVQPRSAWTQEMDLRPWVEKF